MSKNKPAEKPKAAQADAAEPSRFANYFWANLVFFAFLFTLALVVRKSCEAPTDDVAVKHVLDDAFKYLLLLLGGGFLLVTLFDAAYEFFARSAEDGPKDGQAA